METFEKIMPQASFQLKVPVAPNLTYERNKELALICYLGAGMRCEKLLYGTKNIDSVH